VDRPDSNDARRNAAPDANTSGATQAEGAAGAPQRPLVTPIPTRPALPAPPPGAVASNVPQPPPRKRGIWDRLADHGRSFVSNAVARMIGTSEPPASGGETGADAATPGPAPDAGRRVGVLHTVAERLRGAADSFVSAKLDEIEARVDAKLDEIERLIDRKITSLNVQLQELRDRELRHRLRLLRITLIFTVIVALLSLGYKFIDRFWLR
jgi:hypothetical protein